MANQNLGRVDLYVDPSSGGLVINDQLDLQLVVDATQNGLATQQFLERLLTSWPVLTDLLGNVVGRPSDLFNWLWGVALQRKVGQVDQGDLSPSTDAQVRGPVSKAKGIASIDQLVVGEVSTTGYFPVALSVTTTAGQKVGVPSTPVRAF